jgi:hypothetical protein
MVAILTSELTSYTTIRSSSVYLNSVPVATARMTITTTSDTSNFVLGLSNDAGSTFEEVTNATTYTFTDPTGQEVQYQIWGKVPGTSISKVKVRINP